MKANYKVVHRAEEQPWGWRWECM